MGSSLSSARASRQVHNAKPTAAEHPLDDKLLKPSSGRVGLATDRGEFHKITIYYLSLSAGSHLAKGGMQGHFPVFDWPAPRPNNPFLFRFYLQNNPFIS